MSVLGIDIGGSGIKGAPVDLATGEFTAERIRLATPEEAKPDDVAETVAQIARQFDWHGPIGVGFPAVVQHGVIHTAANIDESWINVNAQELFSQATGCPTYVLNDADAAGIAEMRFGIGKERGVQGVVMVITIGTGLGTCLFVDGKLVPNLELGHIEIRGKDAERRASDAARQRKELSWEKWGGRFNEYLNRLQKLLWPDLFVLGGGISKTAETFLPYIDVPVEVVTARLLNQAGIVGAALYAAEQAGVQE